MLKQTISGQRAEISGLYRSLEKKDHDILLLAKENKKLLARLSEYEKPVKDSHNSSIPPSRKPIPARSVRHTSSLREKSGRPNGGQPGHKGITLQQIPVPGETLRHCPDYCQCCGTSLSDIPPQPLGVRQVIDIPEIKPVTREHRVYGKQCSMPSL